MGLGAYACSTLAAVGLPGFCMLSACFVLCAFCGLACVRRREKRMSRDREEREVEVERVEAGRTEGRLITNDDRGTVSFVSYPVGRTAGETKDASRSRKKNEEAMHMSMLGCCLGMTRSKTWPCVEWPREPLVGSPISHQSQTLRGLGWLRADRITFLGQCRRLGTSRR